MKNLEIDKMYIQFVGRVSIEIQQIFINYIKDKYPNAKIDIKYY